jgi:hypothetical protein
MSAPRQPQTLLSNADAILHGRIQNYNIFYMTCKNTFFFFLHLNPLFLHNCMVFPSTDALKYAHLSEFDAKNEVIQLINHLVERRKN